MRVSMLDERPVGQDGASRRISFELGLAELPQEPIIAE